ncbi:efflux RND transporter periplasmic adaptor subunit, partial [Bacteroidota bacterium]
AKVDPEIYLSNYEQIIAALNTQKANLSNSKARLEQVKSQYIIAKATYDRNKPLWEQKVISDADFDAIKSSFEVATAEVNAANESVKAAEYSVQSAQAAVKEAKENLSKTTIFAPTDGIVYNLTVEKGERVVGASQFSSGTEIMRIADLSYMEVSVEVNENDIVRVNFGDTALIEVDAYLNRKFKGIVTEIANSANISGLNADQVTNFDVKIRILQDSYTDLLSDEDTNKSPFRPGMSATVDIQTEIALDVITIPIQAVTTREDSTGRVRTRRDISEDEKEESNSKTEEEEIQEYVFIYADGIAKMQKVKSGIQDNTYIQILEGLDEEQEVVVAPYHAVSKKLKNDDKVLKVDKKELFIED